jgi:hypothetical protein
VVETELGRQNGLTRIVLDEIVKVLRGKEKSEVVLEFFESFKKDYFVRAELGF